MTTPDTNQNHAYLSNDPHDTQQQDILIPEMHVVVHPQLHSLVPNIYITAPNNNNKSDKNEEDGEKGFQRSFDTYNK